MPLDIILKFLRIIINLSQPWYNEIIINSEVCCK